MLFFDPTYLLFILPALALSLWASWRTHAAFKKYSRIGTLRGLTGAQAAQEMLRRAGIPDVQVVPTRGFLSDHYNPANRTLALSEATYASNSVAAVGVPCHEAGPPPPGGGARHPARGGVQAAVAALGPGADGEPRLLGGLLRDARRPAVPFAEPDLLWRPAVRGRAAVPDRDPAGGIRRHGAGQAAGGGDRGRAAPGAGGHGQGAERGGDDLRGRRGLDADDLALLPAGGLGDVAPELIEIL